MSRYIKPNWKRIVKLKEESAVPSQQTEPIRAYSPEQQADIAQKQKYWEELVKPGTVPSEAVVTTVFDARPINGRDFLLTAAGMELVTDTITASFQIPDGYVGILRSFSYEILAPGAEFDGYGLDQYETGDSGFIVAKLDVNGTFVPNYNDMRPGNFVYDMPTYVLADEGQTIRLTVSTASIGYYIIKFVVEFYGNLLLKTGRALNFEPGNEPRPMQVIITPSPKIV